MEIRRTANAGVLLKLDGVSILLDGVCREIKPYPATPPEERAKLCESYPDMVCYTHAHKDHYDPTFAAEYGKQTGGVILGPEELPGCNSTMAAGSVGGVTVTPIPSRHIGGAGKTVSHASFIVKGSQCVWFLGDSSPLLWKDRTDLPKPDFLFVPYAYTTTPTGWTITRNLGAKKTVLLHMPAREEDTIGLWAATEATTKFPDDLLIPSVGQTITL
ncbi:MAG: MBL fold metallo-hydrolase [Oscillospiraceae bacterium]|nr:MBL fold metallo-hydrolase [Oscillospiraceae bacterium]